MILLSPLDDLLDLQNGVVSRRQVLNLAGESDATIRRRVLRREWVMFHPGVYLNHTGTPTWRQRAWAATLYSGGALAGASALRAADGPGRRDHDEGGLIHIVIPGSRRVQERDGIRIERRETFGEVVQPNMSPPRTRVEHAAVDAAAEAPTALGAIAILSDVVRSRRTTAERLLAVAGRRARLARRHLILGVLSDAAAGAASVLEMEFLRRVERPHGLPTALRQLRHVAPATTTSGQGRVAYRDAALPDLRLLLELDGQLGHSTTVERDADFERDLDAALVDRATVRLGWGQAHVRPCVTAAKLAVLYRKRGWRGEFVRCKDCPADLRLPDTAA